MTIPKHPRTAEFVAQGLYAVNSFKELEAKISALETKDDRGAAFEVFAEAFFVTQEGIAPGPCWPESTQIKVFPPNELEALVFPGKFKVCGGAFTIRPLVAGTTGGA